VRRKFLLLLEMGLILAGLALGWSAWKVNSVLEQPLHVTQERLLDVPGGTTPNRMFYRMEARGARRCFLAAPCTGASTWPAPRCTPANTA
jgi:cytochrome c-type biogenesis protein CcmH/NrfG